MKGKHMASTLINRFSEKELLSAAMTIIARKKSPAKAAASRRNGKLGGRPRKQKTA